MAVPTIETMAVTMALRGWEVYADPSEREVWGVPGSHDPHPIFHQPATGRRAFVRASRVVPGIYTLVEPGYEPTWPRVEWDHPEVLVDLPILFKELHDKGLL